MNTVALVLIVVVILAVLIGGYFIYYPKQSSYAPLATPITASPLPTQLANLSASVSIKNFAFDPTPLNIKVGTTVTWTNNDSVPHQIKSDIFNSAALTNGQTFSFTFSAAGAYNYSCAIHPSMLGKIIVAE